MVTSEAWRRREPLLLVEEQMSDPAPVDFEVVTGPTTVCLAQSGFPATLLERLEYGCVNVAGAETANPHQGVTAVPRLPSPADLHLVTFETVSGSHDGGSYVPSQFEDDRTRACGRYRCFHDRQEAADTGVTDGFE
jgi:hypothetical protein